MSSDERANAARQISLKLLLDTNEFIALEPGAGAAEPGLASGADAVRLAHESGHRVYISNATLRDLDQDKDDARRALSRALALKYVCLGPIEPPSQLLAALGEQAPPPDRNSNDDRDLELLSALWVNAVDFLVTEDDRLRRRGGRAGLGERIFTIAETASYLRRLAPTVAAPPPAVVHIKGYQLRADDQIFDSIRASYQDFDAWFRDKVQGEHRPAWVVQDDGSYSAVMIVKDELANDVGLSGQVLKVSTFKVADTARGRSLGELLLKALFSYAHASGSDTIYLTAFDSQVRLIDLLQSFGFGDTGVRNDRNERVLVKVVRPAVAVALTPLEAHVRYGPPFVHPDSDLFVVPITPQWHDALFPDAEFRLPIWTGVHPYGNALLKAYVSGTPSRLVTAGSTLLFYRSGDLSAVTVVGVVEDVRVSPDPEETAQFVGRRTVYSTADLSQMAQRHGELHAMLFRQDRLLDAPWGLGLLRTQGALNAQPQSITQVRKGGEPWVRSRLAESQ